MFGKTPILECWTTLSAIASATTNIRLGTMVTSNGFRNPALLAKMAATVDVISNGRLEFGLGSGVQKDEHVAYGFPFLKPSQRAECLKESVEIIKQMWTQEKTTYKGKHYQIADAVCEPKPLQKPHPPLIIGGAGEKYTLKVTAQYADRFDFGFIPDIEEYKHKLQVLESYCESAGRNFEEIEKSCWPTGQISLKSPKVPSVAANGSQKFELENSVEECASKLQVCLDLGVTHFMLLFADLPDTRSLQLFAQTIVKGNRS
jgi:F420-dependent oxidoreductase-like protein